MASDDALIQQYIESSPVKPGPGEVRIAEHHVPVWALIGYLKHACWDEERAALAYELPRDAVRAARVYYDRNRAVIEARLATNAA